MKILIVSGEYPPMKGGVGRYTQNLVQALRERKNVEVNVAIGEINNKSRALGTPPAKIKHNADALTTDYKINDDGWVHRDVIVKGDQKNSDRLLRLVRKLKPDIVNVQYERGLYENDTSVSQMMKRLIHGSTLHKFFGECPVPTVATLHTVMPHNEYKEYIKDRASRKEGRFASLPLPIRTAMRKWALERRYDLLFEIVNLSSNIISPAQTIKDIIKRGAVIYHGAQAYPLLSSEHQQEYRKELGLPIDKKLLLAFGYVGSYKGFDILNNIKLPEGWSLLIKQNRHERGTEQPIAIENAINLHLDYLDDATLSKLFFASNAIIFPYKIVSVSGVLFDALAHGLPFVASDLNFFREFSTMGLGITCSRDSVSFSKALERLDGDYNAYRNRVNQFSAKLQWNNIAEEYVDFFSKLTQK